MKGTFSVSIDFCQKIDRSQVETHEELTKKLARMSQKKDIHKMAIQNSACKSVPVFG